MSGNVLESVVLKYFFMQESLLSLQPLKLQSDAKPSFTNGLIGALASTDRSEGPHNIFRPESTLSSTDEEELDNIEESLSQSISKLQCLQSQLSGINKNNSSGFAASLNSHRSSVSTPRNKSLDQTHSSSHSNLQEPTMNGLANNMTVQGQKQKTKASLSSIENSYQNIKPKTPVNQVRKSASTPANQVLQSAIILHVYVKSAIYLNGSL